MSRKLNLTDEQRTEHMRALWRAANKRRWQKNPEGQREKFRKFAKENPEKVKNTQIKCKFGIDLVSYYKMLGQQGDGCAICKSTDSKRKGTAYFAIDHDHVTGQVRGLLCDSCNVMLGRAKDDINILQSAILYLKANNE